MVERAVPEYSTQIINIVETETVETAPRSLHIPKPRKHT
jgi:hypothetical protein